MRISDWSSDVCSSDLVQVQARLQAQGVARTQAGGLHARGKQRIPQRDCTVLGQHDLEAVLAGVAGAGDEQRRAVDRLRFDGGDLAELADAGARSEEHTSELPSLMRTSYAVSRF